jgi:hypothetical protein
MYLPVVSKGLKTYPGLPGTALAVGNMGSVDEEVSGDGEKLHTIAFARKVTSRELPPEPPPQLAGLPKLERQPPDV